MPVGYDSFRRGRHRFVIARGRPASQDEQANIIGRDLHMTIDEHEADPEAVTLVGWLRGSTGLRPVAKKAPWITCGLLIQAAGIAMVLAWAYRRYKDDAVEGA